MLGPVHPPPWRFLPVCGGFRYAIVDHDRAIIVTNVPLECGPAMAAAPRLLATLACIVTLTQPGSPAHEVAVGAIETFREREGIQFAEWRPGRPAPRLRIVGEAS